MASEQDNDDDQRRWFRTLRCWLTWFRHPIDELDTLVSACVLVAALAAIVLLGWIVLAFISALGDSSGNFESARNLGLILAAAIGLPFLVWRSWVGERQARAALSQAKSAEENNVTNSFTRAVDQLGATRDLKAIDGSVKIVPNQEIRLGGLYALERLGKTSAPDKSLIAEILSAYLFEHSGAEQNTHDIPT